MSTVKFRDLKANEIQVRPTDTKFKGKATLLLYQDARCFMDILDETVGQFGWQKKYEEIKGNVYCSIGIKDTETGEWVWKSDCGAESNMEAEKGEASDAGKRAAVCWGIGRSLYTGPEIKITCPDSYYYNDKLTMKFYVKSITYDNGKITSIVIVDRFDKEVFNWSREKGSQKREVQSTRVENSAPSQVSNTNETIEAMKAYCREQYTAFKNRDEVGKANEVQQFVAHYTKILSEGNWKGEFLVDKLLNNWINKSYAKRS